MAIDRSYVARNDTQRRRLRALVLLEAWKFKGAAAVPRDFDEDMVNWIN